MQPNRALDRQLRRPISLLSARCEAHLSVGVHAKICGRRRRLLFFRLRHLRSGAALATSTGCRKIPFGEPTMNDDRSIPAGYEAPCIEQVLTADELDREVHYAGGSSVPV